MKNAHQKALILRTGLTEQEAALRELRSEYLEVSKRLKIERKKYFDTHNAISGLEKKIREQMLEEEEKIRLLKSNTIALVKEILRSKTLWSADRDFFESFLQKALEEQRDEKKEEQRAAREEERKRKNEEKREGERAKERYESQSRYYENTEDLVKEWLQNRLNKEEKAELRKLYLELAQKFHPDKAETGDETNIFNRIMQRINEAYKHSDIEELRRIDKEYRHFGTVALVELDFLNLIQKEIEFIRESLSSMDEQLTVLKATRRRLEHSEIGKIQKMLKKEPHRTGELFQALGEKNYQELSILKSIFEGFKFFKEKGKFPKHFLDGRI
ncbi:MAG: J domain-containing protein [Chloroherpetonaceae bacterium]|nr:J domain-containing protein [Chloroherpetonaceae bacterium]